jgi:uncharacterized protein with PIN domain
MSNLKTRDENKLEELQADAEELKFYEDAESIEDTENQGDIEENKLYIDNPKIPLRQFKDMFEDGELDLQPEYQRKFVIDEKKASRIVESVLLDIPLPLIYLAEENDGTYSVIDGQQRLTSLISFQRGVYPDKNEFLLKGLTKRKDLNKKIFAELTSEDQRKIKNYSIQTIIIKKESNDEIKFEIFERLNTGSTSLNEDEIRNSVYRGKYIQLLSELEEHKDFHKLINKTNFKKRMIYRGMILRFLTFYEKTYLKYKPSMKSFCNAELKEKRDLSNEKREEYIHIFNHCVDLVKNVFGDKAFKRFEKGNESDANGSWVKTRLNMALFDIQMAGFANYKKDEIMTKADEIREAMIHLMTDDVFRNSILLETSNKDVVKTRFEIWFKKLEEIVQKREINRRAFSFDEKKQLFQKSSTCAYCRNQILDIDDAEVDHIVPFSKMGETKFENAQLLHRFCNRTKSNT